MDFIRSEKSKPDYDNNTRHCLYGLDADLVSSKHATFHERCSTLYIHSPLLCSQMMLGLSTHEPHFALLREEVRFGGKESKKRYTTVEETAFYLLHLTLFREYLDYEFSSLKVN